ncbi:LamG-like jellyroll fold domain-containing protein [Prosthecobacter sp.]|uniref:LamG-like jellyroll fold domain-containing protein n=1 Tax=Prosthecobacter sp. TaxID=1965333 RepID=UPI003782DF69
MSEDLHEIIAAWFGEEMPEARREALLLRLRTDPEFRSDFVTELRTFAMLHAVQSPEPRWLALQDELGIKNPQNDFSEERIREAIRKQPRPFVASWWRPVAAMAAGLAAVFAVLLLMNPSQPASPNRENLAVAVRVDGVKWSAAQRNAPQMGGLVGSGDLRLDSGKLTLAFLSGVSVHIEGPADITLLGPERIACRRGNVRTLVNEGAEGFTIETPGGAVVDLGTEFGVNVEGDGKAQVVVYQGQAELALLSPDGSPRRTRLLNAQQSSELDPQADTFRGIEPREILAAPDLRIPALELSADYSQRIFKSKPLHYWRGQSAASGSIADAAHGAKALHIHGAVVPQPDGSLAFAEGDEPQFLRAEGEWTPPAEFAVELWFASGGFHNSALAVMHALDDEHDTLSLLQLTRRDARNALRPARVRFLFRWPPGSRDGMNVYSAPLYTPYRWQHLVCQRRGDALEMYLDGRRVGETSLQGDEKTTACVLRFGRLFEAAGKRDSRPFVGRMAEMAVYDHLLSAEEIHAHAAR